MKMKFIFNIVDSLGRPAPQYARPGFRAALILCFIVAGAPFIWPQTPPTPVTGTPAYTQNGQSNSPTPAPDTPVAADPSDPAASDDPPAMFPHFKDTRFWLSGQANFIFQTHPAFPALYSGTHSLGPNYEKGTSRVMTLYTGVRINNSTELLVDIEEAGGTALSQGFGLAGNTDLDIVRNPALSKAPYLAGA